MRIKNRRRVLRQGKKFSKRQGKRRLVPKRGSRPRGQQRTINALRENIRH
jgi:hypothetical protein